MFGFVPLGLQRFGKVILWVTISLLAVTGAIALQRIQRLLLRGRLSSACSSALLCDAHSPPRWNPHAFCPDEESPKVGAKLGCANWTANLT